MSIFGSKAFSARPVYFLKAVKSRPGIAVNLCHEKKIPKLFDIKLEIVVLKKKIYLDSGG